MKFLSLLAIALTLGLGLTTGDAEAKRLGGSKSIGMQRQMAPAPAKPPAAAPAPTAPATTTAAAPAKAPAAAPATGRSWMGPLAGLAAGLGLAALASYFGFGEELASLMLLALLAFVVIAVVGLLMRKRMGTQEPALAGAYRMPYSAERSEPDRRSFEYAAAGTAGPTAKIPADFDVDGFVRSAKVHFIRLQAANDAGNLEDIRAFTTPEMFAELKMDIAERGGTGQETDVVAIDAEVLEVVEEADRYVASILFRGQIREERHGPVVPFEEVWHLVKPRDGRGGWLLAGIQQTH